MKRDRTHCRVFADTLEAMRKLIAEMEDGVSQGRGNRFWAGETLGTAELIQELVLREIRHRERGRKRPAKGER